MRTYLRCAWANKATLAGWYFLALFVVLVTGKAPSVPFSLEVISLWLICGCLALYLLVITLFGEHTVHVYKEIRAGGIQLSENYAKKWDYCARVGFRLAQRDLLRERKKAAQ